ncbi:MAG: energy transducer TonB [Edaphobacter sp.]
MAVASAEKRWTAVASVALQMAIAAAVIALPLLHPEGLPIHVDTPKVLMPLMPKPPVPVVVVERAPSGPASSFAPPSESRPLIFTQTTSTETTTGDLPVLAPIGVGMGERPEMPPGLGIGEGTGPSVSVVTPKPAPLRISSGLSDGMLIAPIRPVYPAIAKAAGVQGAVVVEAVISKTGTIESLHVVSGPMMLQNSALEAIREARYRPYRLNGEAIEVQISITVNFRMGG